MINVNPGLRDICRLRLRAVYAYRTWAYLGVLQVLLQLLLVRAVWKAVFGDRPSVDSISIDTMITYLTMVGLLNFLIRPEIVNEVHQRVDQGQIAIDMLRPVGFIKQVLAMELGWVIGRAAFLPLIVPCLMLLGSLDGPPATTFVFFLLSFVLALTVSTLIWLIVGLSSFWVINVQGIRSTMGVVGSFLAGSMIPVWFMPEPLRSIVTWLPFQAINYLPASIYVGEASGPDMWRALATQIGWAVVLGALATWIWRRARQRVVVQGG